MKQKVLFICVHNSARSQMAEAFLKEICGDHFEAHSAGLEPGKLNPLAIETMREIGIDISKNQTQSVFDVFKTGELFACVITVCDESSCAALSHLCWRDQAIALEFSRSGRAQGHTRNAPGRHTQDPRSDSRAY
jgi:protein-tyrosine-phosphatase